MKQQLLTLSLAGLILSVSQNATAYPKHDPNVYDQGNLWSMTFYNDDSTVHAQWATQRICFLPYSLPGVGQTQIKGKWYSTSFPNWHGSYRQEGDSVKMVGNYANGVGNDSINFDIVTNSPKNVGAGHWSEWRDNGRFSPFTVFGNTRLERIGKCRVLISSEQANIAERKLIDGKSAEYPGQEGQEALTRYNEYEDPFSEK